MESNLNNHLLSSVEWSAKGDHAIANDDFEKAIYCYSEAIDLVPTNHLYFSNRSSAYLSNHDATQALADAEKCIDLNSSWEAGYDQKGRALHELGDFDSSIEAYEQGLGVEPNSALLEKGLASVKRSAQKYSCPSPASMVDAARAGDLAGINVLLRMGCGVNESVKNIDEDGLEETPLGAAMRYRKEKAMRLLLAAGADVNIDMNKGRQHVGPMSPTYLAVKRGHAGVVELLFKAGASVHEHLDEDHKTLLHVAADRGHVEVVRVLLAAGARLDARTKARRENAIGMAVSRGHADMVELLIKAGASVHEHLDEDQWTLLHFAVTNDNVEVVRVLLAAGARMDARTKEDGIRPMHIAVSYGHAEVVELLINAGASVQEPIDEDGMTLLHAAAGEGHVEVARLLLAAGARVNASSKTGRRLPITGAVLHGHTGMVELLIKAGASVDAQNDQGFSLLHIAARDGRVEVARVLLAAGARVDVRTKSGDTSLMLAACECNDEVVEVLVEAGATVDARENSNQLTPLMGCLSNGECLSKPVAGRKTVQLLIKAGADVNPESHVGICMMKLAAIACCPGIVQDLLDAGAKIVPRGNKGLKLLSSNVGRVPPQLAAKIEKLLKSAEWKQRVADTKAVLRGWKKKRQQAKQAARGGAGTGAGAEADAGAGAAPESSLIVRAKDGQCGKVQENGEKKKKKKNKRAVKDENRVCDGPDCNSLGVNRCKACKRPAYCGVECQRAHWNGGHKQECKMWREEDKLTSTSAQ